MGPPSRSQVHTQHFVVTSEHGPLAKPPCSKGLFYSFIVFIILKNVLNFPGWREVDNRRGPGSAAPGLAPGPPTTCPP